MRTEPRGAGSPVAVLERAATKKPAPNPLFGVAMLKIALEMKRSGESVDEIVGKVLVRMRLPEDEFRAYLSHNGGLLRLIAKPKGHAP